MPAWSCAGAARTLYWKLGTEEAAHDVDVHISIGSVHRQLEAQARYDEAKAVDSDVKKLRLQESARRHRQLQSHHVDQQLTLEEEHRRDFIAKQAAWDARMLRLEHDSSRQRHRLAMNHASDISQLGKVRRPSSTRRAGLLNPSLAPARPDKCYNVGYG